VLLGVSGVAIAEAKQEAEASPPAASEQGQSNGISRPVQMVRTLQLMQDQIALGSTEAHI